VKKLPESVLLELDQAKQRFIKKRFGSFGIAWIRDFPELIQTCLEQWGLTLIGRAEAGLAVNSVFFVQRGEQSCVLKVGLPQPEQLTEIEALGLFSSDQVVNVLAWDEPKRALLMERIQPGLTLRSLLDNPDLDTDLVSYAAPLLMSLQVPAEETCQLPTYQNWLKDGFSPEVLEQAPKLAQYVDLALRLNRRLTDRWNDVFVLHGDLHHDNILKENHLGWVAIDPKGVIGPRIYDCGRFIHNFIPFAADRGCTSEAVALAAGLILRRCQTLSELSRYPTADLIAVGFIDLTLASSWSVADGETVNYSLLQAFSYLLHEVI
jgi:streptomycin 6-kinase